jgi:hypothetical protein
MPTGSIARDPLASASMSSSISSSLSRYFAGLSAASRKPSPSASPTVSGTAMPWMTAFPSLPEFRSTLTITVYGSEWMTPASNYISSYLSSTATAPSAAETQIIQTSNSALQLTTRNGISLCREYPDTITTDWSRVSNLTTNSPFSANCWSRSSIDGPLGLVDNSNLWLHSKEKKCWLNSKNVAQTADFTSLTYCPSPEHRVVRLQPHYSRQDCYEGLTLDAVSLLLDRYWRSF